MNEYKLKDLIHIHNGRPYAHLSDGIIPVYGSGGIICYVNEALYDREAILLPRKGTLNYIMYSNQKIWVIDTMYYATTNNKACPYYLYRYLGLLSLSHLDSGSALPSMTQATYYDIKVKLPNIKTQQRIASVLSALDDKIELNNRINAELEAMVKTLYDYWFVQFDFPDANGKPYKSSGGKMVYSEELKREIPEGWEVKKLYKIESNIVTGKTPSTKIKEYFNGDIPFVTINDIRKQLYIFNSERTLTKKGADSQTSKYLYSGDICVSCIGTIGVIGIAGKTIQTNQQINSLSNIKDYNRFFLLNSLKNYFNFNIAAKKGAILDNMNKEEFAKIPILDSSIELKKLYLKIVNPIYEKTRINLIENQQLASLRDWLLPMLMNGQVGFKETTHKVGKSQQKDQHLELLLSK